MSVEELPGSALAPVFPLRERDGANPIERKAVYRAQVEIRSMPASLVVQIALWPDKLADWAKETGVAPAVVYNMLAGVKPYHRVRTLLARRLDVPKRILDHLIDAPRPEPQAKVPPSPPEPADRGNLPGESGPPAGPASGGPGPPPAKPKGADQREPANGSRERPRRMRPRGRLSTPSSQITLNL